MKRVGLRVSGLFVKVDGKQVLKEVKLKINPGEVVVLSGPNGSGKSSLVNTLLGDPKFEVQDSAKVEFWGRDLLAMSVDERARAGLYVAWQNPVVIPGVSVFNLCKSSYEAMGGKIEKLTEFKRTTEELAERVGLKKEHVSRSVNEGFSGGERKRLELLQLLLLKPKLAILDEIDSGLDLGGVKALGQIVEEMQKRGTGFVIITHNKRLLEEIRVDKTWEMKDGRISTGI